MWVNYKGVMVLVGVGRNASYKIINQLNDELAKKGYLVNPHHKVPIKFLCERYGIDKKIRAAMNKEFNELETKRKSIKKAVASLPIATKDADTAAIAAVAPLTAVPKCTGNILTEL